MVFKPLKAYISRFYLDVNSKTFVMNMFSITYDDHKYENYYLFLRPDT